MYAPEFVFGIASAELTSRYITSSLEIETIAYKISMLLQSNYSGENSENIKSTATKKTAIIKRVVTASALILMVIPFSFRRVV